jgi:hypothetical protein
MPTERAAAVQSNRAKTTQAVASVVVAREAEPTVSLKLEPVAAAVTTLAPPAAQEVLGPVALPGYVLPVEGSVEAAHAGS